MMSFDSSHWLGQTVGAKIRAARLAKKYTQSQLAHPDFSVSYISAIERGQIQPSIRALEILAKRLEISTSALLPPYGQTTTDSHLIQVDHPSLQEERRALVLLEAQIALYQGGAEEAIVLLREFLEQNSGRNQDIAVRALLGRAYLEGGHLQESEQTLARVAKQAHETKDRLYPRILSLHAAVYAAMHNLTRAIQLEEESLAVLKETSNHDVFFLAQVYSNLGHYYSHQGESAQALAMFKLALTTVEVRTTYGQLQPIYWDIMQYHKEQEELPQVALYSQKWLLADMQRQFSFLRSRLQHALGRALLKSKPEEAYTYLLAEYQKAESHDPLWQASVAVQLANWFMTHNQLSEAEPYIHQAHVLSVPFGETAIAAEASLLLGKVCYTRQEYESGDQWFETGLAMLEHVGEEEELAEYLTHYAELLEERDLPEKAFEYWRRAFEYEQRKQKKSW
jgi:tetratricopeptide (TPR) repeat protein